MLSKKNGCLITTEEAISRLEHYRENHKQMKDCSFEARMYEYYCKEIYSGKNGPKHSIGQAKEIVIREFLKQASENQNQRNLVDVMCVYAAEDPDRGYLIMINYLKNLVK